MALSASWMPSPTSPAVAAQCKGTRARAPGSANGARRRSAVPEPCLRRRRAVVAARAIRRPPRRGAGCGRDVVQPLPDPRKIPGRRWPMSRLTVLLRVAQFVVPVNPECMAVRPPSGAWRSSPVQLAHPVHDLARCEYEPAACEADRVTQLAREEFWRWSSRGSGGPGSQTFRFELQCEGVRASSE